MSERAAEQKVIKPTRHFISVGNQDSNDFGSPDHNPGQMYISMGNSGITNVQSYNDSTATTLTPISLTADIFYNNVSQSFRNNKFRLSTVAGDQLALNGVGENVAPLTLTIPDQIYKTGAELATAFQTRLNSAASPVGWRTQIVNNVPNTGASNFAAASVSSAAFANAADRILITNVVGYFRNTTVGGGGTITATVHRADTNAVLATSSAAAVGAAMAPITFTFPPGTILTGNATGIFFTFTWAGGVVGEWSYGTANAALAMSAFAQTTISTFAVTFGAATNSLTLAYNTAHPTNTPTLVLTTAFVESGIEYDSTRLWGTTFSVFPGDIKVSGTFQLPYANRVAGLQLPNYVDLQTLQVIRLHSNVAKRTFAKRGATGLPPSQRVLSLTDILFEIPLDGALGSTLVWQPSDNRFMQDIASNFDELRLTITDNRDNLVQFTQAAEINFTFAIERQIIVPDNEERIKALSDYNRFRSY